MEFQLIHLDDEEFLKAVVGTKVKYINNRAKNEVRESIVVRADKRQCRVEGRYVLWFDVVEWEPHIAQMLGVETLQEIAGASDNNSGIIDDIIDARFQYETK